MFMLNELIGSELREPFLKTSFVVLPLLILYLLPWNFLSPRNKIIIHKLQLCLSLSHDPLSLECLCHLNIPYCIEKCILLDQWINGKVLIMFVQGIVITLMHVCFCHPWINMTALHSGGKCGLNKVDLVFSWLQECSIKRKMYILAQVHEIRSTRCVQ